MLDNIPLKAGVQSSAGMKVNTLRKPQANLKLAKFCTQKDLEGLQLLAQLIQVIETSLNQTANACVQENIQS